jgi:hypothetical protein
MSIHEVLLSIPFQHKISTNVTKNSINKFCYHLVTTYSSTKKNNAVKPSYHQLVSEFDEWLLTLLERRSSRLLEQPL